MLRFNCLFTILLVSLSALHVQSGDDDWTVLEVLDLSRTIPDYAYDYTLSPDGATLAWSGSGDPCILTLATKQRSCYVSPTDLEIISWSPDSQYLLLGEYVTSIASRYMVYDRMTDQITPITGITYSIGDPIWRPASKELYFLSYQYERGSQGFVGLNRHSMMTDEESMVDFGNLFGSDYYSVELEAVSPDGTEIVISNEYAINSSFPEAGLWQINVAEQSIEALATVDQLQAGMPKREYGYAVIESAFWNTDLSQLLVVLEDQAYVLHTLGVSRIDWETKILAPLLNYSDLPVPEESIAFDGIGQISPDGLMRLYTEASAKGTYPSYLTIYALPLSAGPDSDPILVTNAYPGPTNCETKALLITFEHEGQTKSYLLSLTDICVG